MQALYTPPAPIQMAEKAGLSVPVAGEECCLRIASDVTIDFGFGKLDEPIPNAIGPAILPNAFPPMRAAVQNRSVVALKN